jgi:hypothetical protein
MMNTGKRQAAKVFARAFRLQCPACGKSSIARAPFRIRDFCPECRSIFKREQGFFVGAILANMLTTEFVILAVCGICVAWIGYDYESVLAGVFVVALVFPVLFYHHSWSLWLAFDYLIEGLPKHTTRAGHEL